MGIAPWYPRTKVPAHQAHLIGKPGTQLPITKIWNQLQANNAHAVANVKYAVLTFSGSFNPVHSSHLAAMDEASNVLIAKGYTVLGGFIVPSSPGYVNAKLEEQAMPLKHRVAMVKEACQNTPWEALDWGDASSPRIKNQVNQYLREWCQRVLPNISIETYEVGGADYVAKSLQRGSHALLNPYTVCVGRGTDTQYVKNNMHKLRHLHNFYLSANNVPAASSTNVRSLLAQKDWTALINLYYMYPGVLHLMKQLFDADKLFINGNDMFLAMQGATMPTHQHPHVPRPKNPPMAPSLFKAQGNLPGGFSVGEKVYRIRDSRGNKFFTKGKVGTVMGAVPGSNDKVMVDYPGKTGDWNTITSIRSVNSLPACKCGCGNPVHPPDIRGSYNVCCTDCTQNNGHSKECYYRSGQKKCHNNGCSRPANIGYEDCCHRCKWTPQPGAARDHASWCKCVSIHE